MPVVTIGRQIGAGGRTVGHMLATKLNADFLDSQLIDEVAHRLQLPREEVEAEDEHPGSLLSDHPGALHVFLRAAQAIRVKTIMERENKTEDEARRRMKLADENWTAYIKQVYGHDRNLASHYDLVLDTGRLGYDATVAAVLAALPGRSR